MVPIYPSPSFHNILFTVILYHLHIHITFLSPQIMQILDIALFCKYFRTHCLKDKFFF